MLSSDSIKPVLVQLSTAQLGFLNHKNNLSMEEIFLVLGQIAIGAVLFLGVSTLTAYIFGPRSKKGGRNG